MEKLRKWKKGMELKGLRVNIDRTKVMRCQVRIGQAEDSGKYPCGVCKQGVGDNSIKCVACHKWVHNRCSSEDLCNLLGINCVADVVRRGRLRWFGHLERKSVDDWVSACRGLVVEGTRGRGRSRKTWGQCVRDDMKLLGLHPEWAVFRDMRRDLIWGKRLISSLNKDNIYV